MSRGLIDDAETLDDVVERMSSNAEVAIDVEGDGLFRYRSRLCTVQLCSVGEVVVVDTLAIRHLGALGRLLGPGGPTKIVHDASFDVRLLREYGVALDDVFDTSIAARFLGEPATGLSALVDKYVGVRLSKDQQHSDWGRRPLDEESLTYLEQDVLHLSALASALRMKMAERDISREVAEECAYVIARARDERPDPRPPWMRIKKWEELPAVGRAVLREVADVRERTAQELDVPPFKVVGNDALLALAERRPRSTGAASQIRGLQRGRARRILRELVDAVARGVRAGDVPRDELPGDERRSPPREEREARKRRQKALGSWRRKAAAERGVDVQVVLPGHCLTDLAQRGASTVEDLRAIEGLGDFRVERYGVSLLAALG